MGLRAQVFRRLLLRFVKTDKASDVQISEGGERGSDLKRGEYMINNVVLDCALIQEALWEFLPFAAELTQLNCDWLKFYLPWKAILRQGERCNLEIGILTVHAELHTAADKQALSHPWWVKQATRQIRWTEKQQAKREAAQAASGAASPARRGSVSFTPGTAKAKAKPAAQPGEGAVDQKLRTLSQSLVDEMTIHIHTMQVNLSIGGQVWKLMLEDLNLTSRPSSDGSAFGLTKRPRVTVRTLAVLVPPGDPKIMKPTDYGPLLQFLECRLDLTPFSFAAKEKQENDESAWSHVQGRIVKLDIVGCEGQFLDVVEKSALLGRGETFREQAAAIVLKYGEDTTVTMGTQFKWDADDLDFDGHLREVKKLGANLWAGVMHNAALIGKALQDAQTQDDDIRELECFRELLVRSGPGLSQPEVCRLPEGTKIVLGGERQLIKNELGEELERVSIREPVVGWISTAFLRWVEQRPQTPSEPDLMLGDLDDFLGGDLPALNVEAVEKKRVTIQDADGCIAQTMGDKNGPGEAVKLTDEDMEAIRCRSMQRELLEAWDENGDGSDVQRWAQQVAPAPVPPAGASGDSDGEESASSGFSDDDDVAGGPDSHRRSGTVVVDCISLRLFLDVPQEDSQIEVVKVQGFFDRARFHAQRAANARSIDKLGLACRMCTMWVDHKGDVLTLLNRNAIEYQEESGSPAIWVEYRALDDDNAKHGCEVYLDGLAVSAAVDIWKRMQSMGSNLGRVAKKSRDSLKGEAPVPPGVVAYLLRLTNFRLDVPSTSATKFALPKQEALLQCRELTLRSAEDLHAALQRGRRGSEHFTPRASVHGVDAAEEAALTARPSVDHVWVSKQELVDLQDDRNALMELKAEVEELHARLRRAEASRDDSQSNEEKLPVQIKSTFFGRASG
mmetsp:Transcript_44494/g.117660  ORF Transcript_44494/g.117660 Transcript_44494/m.117660 type:complete len:903 (+) Transcript_44494:57-2765(+)